MHRDNVINFMNAGFGMFIHWGLYSIPGGRWKGERMDYIGEWIQSHFRIPNAEYAKLAEQFNPTSFNAEEWVKAAKEAGMAYIVFTAKHHDGFSMYHSRVSKYNIVDATPFGRDVLRELADACLKYGMKLGIYYSHCLDWHECDGADPGPASPRNFGMSWGNDWDFPKFDEKDFQRYFEHKAIPQIRELLTGYGPVFLLWFDCPLQISQEQCRTLCDIIRSLQPDCLINGRIGHNMGDFGSLGDNQSPAGQSQQALESANTLNRTWGFKKDDHNWRDANQVITGLISSKEKGVNYLLNIGPRSDGRFPDASLDVLKEIAEWRERNDVLIQNTTSNPFPQPFSWGYCTVAGNVIQFFVTERRNNICIPGLRNRVKCCNMPFEQDESTVYVYLPEERNDDLPLVVKLEMDDKPNIDTFLSLKDDALILSPAIGELICGQKTEMSSSGIELGAAAEILCEEGKCSLSSDGALTQWHHPGDGVCWEIRLPEAGTYEFRAVTENRRHSIPWIGKRNVLLEFSKKNLKCELVETEKMPSPYYARASSVIGSLNFPEPTDGILKFINLNINNPEAKNMNLIQLEVYKQNGGRQHEL